MDLDDEELRATRIMNGANKSLGYVYKLEQRIKELEKIEEEHRKENGELRERVKGLEEENTVLKKANNISENTTVEDITNFMNKSLEDFNKEYIPVYLVKEKIGELHNKYIKILNDYGNTSTDIIINVVSKEARKDLDEIVNQIQILQELLEKR